MRRRSSQDCHLSVNHSKVKIFIDICNAAKIMLVGKGSSLAVGCGCGFISIIKLSESLGTYLASTTLQAKPAWARGKAKQVPQCIKLAPGGGEKRLKSIPVVHSSHPKASEMSRSISRETSVISDLFYTDGKCAHTILQEVHRVQDSIYSSFAVLWYHD